MSVYINLAPSVKIFLVHSFRLENSSVGWEGITSLSHVVQAQWLMPVIPALWEAKVGGSRAQIEIILATSRSLLYNKIKIKKLVRHADMHLWSCYLGD